MPQEKCPGKASSRRYAPAEKEQCVYGIFIRIVVWSGKSAAKITRKPTSTWWASSI